MNRFCHKCFPEKLRKPSNSFMTKVPIKYKPGHRFASKSMDWFLYDRNLRHERVKKFENFLIQKVSESLRKFLKSFTKAFTH